VSNLGVYIIAEAGDNHNGRFDLAVRLIDAAAAAGADCVKFQTFITEEVISKCAQKAQYQKETTGNHETEFEMVKKLDCLLMILSASLLLRHKTNSVSFRSV
jgi:sialic acid synthase SpsE